MCSQEISLWQLRVVADADPGTVARVLERFQNLNVVPRRIVAEFFKDDTLHIQVDVCGLTEEQFKLITAKIGQNVSIVNAYWHRV
jgi:hypothetical protein